MATDVLGGSVRFPIWRTKTRWLKSTTERSSSIKDGEILGAYDSHIEAVRESQKTHELGTFLVQAVSPGPDAYTQTFHSRIMRF